MEEIQSICAFFAQYPVKFAFQTSYLFGNGCFRRSVETDNAPTGLNASVPARVVRSKATRTDSSCPLDEVQSDAGARERQ